MPRVSVIIPTYNRASLIAETLESVAAQTFSDWECLVVDDGSTDDTAEVVGRFVARDGRFRHIRQENAGVAAARNRGIVLAQGAYLAFVDSDDLFPPDRLAWMTAILDADPAVSLVYGNTFMFRGGDVRDGHIYQGERPDRPSGHAFEALMTNSSIYAPLVRADRIREAGGFDPEMEYAEDWDAWIRVARTGRVAFDPRISLYYRYHEGNRYNHASRLYHWSWRVVRKNLRGLPPWQRLRLALGARRYFRTIYPDWLLQEAWDRSCSGDLRGARRVWWDLLALDPGRLRGREVRVCALRSLVPAWVRSLRQSLRGRLARARDAAAGQGG